MQCSESWPASANVWASIGVKIWLSALLHAADFELEGGRYDIVDAFNISAVPPRGRLLLWTRHATERASTGVAY